MVRKALRGVPVSPWIWNHTLPTTLKGLSRHSLVDYKLLMFIFKNFLASIILQRLIDENF